MKSSWVLRRFSGRTFTMRLMLPRQHPVPGLRLLRLLLFVTCHLLLRSLLAPLVSRSCLTFETEVLPHMPHTIFRHRVMKYTWNAKPKVEPEPTPSFILSHWQQQRPKFFSFVSVEIFPTAQLFRSHLQYPTKRIRSHTWLPILIYPTMPWENGAFFELYLIYFTFNYSEINSTLALLNMQDAAGNPKSAEMIWTANCEPENRWDSLGTQFLKVEQNKHVKSLLKILFVCAYHSTHTHSHWCCDCV